MTTWKNTDTAYGRISKILHWVMAVLILGLVALGWYMVDLTYYDRWYNDSLAYHKALGMVALFLAAGRIAWVAWSRPPGYVARLSRLERAAAAATHHLFYLATVVMPVSGYLVSTSEGEGIAVFGLFTLPAVVEVSDGVRDVAIEVHYYSTYGVALLALVHAAAAVKHQWLDRDGTLKRML